MSINGYGLSEDWLHLLVRVPCLMRHYRHRSDLFRPRSFPQGTNARPAQGVSRADEFAGKIPENTRLARRPQRPATRLAR